MASAALQPRTVNNVAAVSTQAVSASTPSTSGVLGASTKLALPAAASAMQHPAPDGGAAGGTSGRGVQFIAAGESPTTAVAADGQRVAPKVQSCQVDQGAAQCLVPPPLPNTKPVGDTLAAAQPQPPPAQQQQAGGHQQPHASMSSPAPRAAMVRVVRACTLLLYSQLWHNDILKIAHTILVL